MRVDLGAVDDADPPPDDPISPTSSTSRNAAETTEEADEWPAGLVAVGGTLDPDRLLSAYRLGVPTSCR